jgi:hypothetical protein
VSPTTTSADALEGTWVTRPSCAEQESALVRAGFTPKQLAQDEERCAYAEFRLRLLDGRLVVFQDGDVGWDGRYRSVDDKTFVAGDGDNGFYITYKYRVSHDQLVVDMVEDTCPFCAGQSELLGEKIAQTRIFESSPYAREH